MRFLKILNVFIPFTFRGSLSIENIQKTLVSALVALQQYISAFIQWCVQLLSSSVATDTDTPAQPQAAADGA